MEAGLLVNGDRQLLCEITVMSTGTSRSTTAARFSGYYGDIENRRPSNDGFSLKYVCVQFKHDIYQLIKNLK